MPTWYATADKLLAGFMLKPPPIPKGMAAAVAALRSKRNAADADKLADVDWAVDQPRFERWLGASLRYGKLPADIAGLWFSAPEIELNDPITYVIGSRSFDDRQGKEDWASDAAWTQDEGARKQRKTPKAHAGEFPLRALADLQKRLEVGPKFNPEHEHLDRTEPLRAGLALVYVGLLVRHAMAALDADLALGSREWRGVGFGFSGGDLTLAGVRTRKGRGGWSQPGKAFRVTVVDEAPRLNTDPTLDLNSDEFSPNTYLKSGLDLNARGDDGETALIHALSPMRGPQWKLVRAYIEAGADVNLVTTSANYGPMLSLVDGPTDLLELAIAKGGDVNMANDIGMTPLHAALRGEPNVDNVRALLRAGADPNKRDGNGRGALHTIAAEGLPNYQKTRRSHAQVIIQLLLDAGAKLEATDATGATPLMTAVVEHARYIHSDSEHSSSKHDTIAILLLEAGAKPNPSIKDSPDPLIPAGATPLMCLRYDDGSMHLALLEHGADPMLKCRRGVTPIEYATKALKSKKTRTVAGAQRALDAMLAATGNRPEVPARKRSKK